MLFVGLKVLKNKLSEYVRLAAAGETVLISDRERVVAELVPPRAAETASAAADSALAEAVHQGFLTPPTGNPGPPPPTPGVAPLEEVISGLAADRADR